jgi:TPR repeat protein
VVFYVPAGKIAVAPFNIYNILMEEANAPYVTEDSLLQRAQEWLVIAAEQAHDVTAQYQLGCIIRDGKCVIKPPRTAYEYFKESADRGYVYSQFNAAKCLIDGTHGAEKSPKIAMHYYRMASNQGAFVFKQHLHFVC